MIAMSHSKREGIRKFEYADPLRLYLQKKYSRILHLMEKKGLVEFLQTKSVFPANEYSDDKKEHRREK